MSMDLERKVQKYQRSRKGIFRVEPTIIGKNPHMDTPAEAMGFAGSLNDDYRQRPICERLIISESDFIPIAQCADQTPLQFERRRVICPKSCEKRGKKEGEVNKNGFLVMPATSSDSSRK